MKFVKQKTDKPTWIARSAAIYVITLDDDGAYRTWTSADIPERDQAFDSLIEAKQYFASQDAQPETR